MGCRWLHSIVVLALFAPITTARAEVITKCTSSNGYAYYFGGKAMPVGKAGWQKEASEGSEIKFVQDGKALDIIITDTRGERSLKAQGFQVFSIPQSSPGFMMVVAIHSRGVVNHYLYELDALGNGRVVWGAMQGSSWPIQKSTLFEAPCRSP